MSAAAGRSAAITRLVCRENAGSCRRECIYLDGALYPWRSWKAATESGCSGCWRYVHVEGKGAGVVVLGIAFLGERDGGQAFAFGLFAAGGASAVDVQGRTRLRQVKFAEIASLLAQFATANVSTTACEGSILERLRS